MALFTYVRKFAGQQVEKLGRRARSGEKFLKRNLPIPPSRAQFVAYLKAMQADINYASKEIDRLIGLVNYWEKKFPEEVVKAAETGTRVGAGFAEKFLAKLRGKISPSVGRIKILRAEATNLGQQVEAAYTKALVKRLKEYNEAVKRFEQTSKDISKAIDE